MIKNKTGSGSVLKYRTLNGTLWRYRFEANRSTVSDGLSARKDSRQREMQRRRYRKLSRHFRWWGLLQRHQNKPLPIGFEFGCGTTGPIVVRRSRFKDTVRWPDIFWTRPRVSLLSLRQRRLTKWITDYWRAHSTFYCVHRRNGASISHPKRSGRWLAFSPSR